MDDGTGGLVFGVLGVCAWVFVLFVFVAGWLWFSVLGSALGWVGSGKGVDKSDVAT